MLSLSQPHPLHDIVASIDAKTPLGSAMRTAEWQAMPAALREAAFFSASVESTRWLARAQQGISEIIARARASNEKGEQFWKMDRAKLMADLRQLGQEIGVPRPGGRKDDKIRETDITDPLSISRLRLIIETQLETAYGKADWLTGMDPDILEAFPGWELVRLSDRMVPRDWPARWKAAADLINWEGVSREAFTQGRLIALKTSQIWKLLSRFGNPHAPLDFNSGMGMDDVDRAECEELGIIGPDDVLTPNVKSHQEEIKASLKGFEAKHEALLRKLMAKRPVDVQIQPQKQIQVKLRTPDLVKPAKLPPPVKTPPLPASTPPSLPAAKVARVTVADLQKAGDAFTQEFSCKVQFTAGAMGRRWGAKMSNAESVAHLTTVGAEWRRLRAAFPQMPTRPLHTFLCIASKRGRAHLDGPVAHMSTKSASTAWPLSSHERNDRWEKLHGHPWGTERWGSQVEDNFRHEMGHTLSTPQVMEEFRKKCLRPLGISWFRQNVSEYAHTKPAEALAETFGVCTRIGYVRGTYPQIIEDFIFKFLLQEA
ncbi:MAG: hypothetical protein V4662_12040 [Verrucomicrobiota bacterium]